MAGLASEDGPPTTHQVGDDGRASPCKSDKSCEFEEFDFRLSLTTFDADVVDEVGKDEVLLRADVHEVIKREDPPPLVPEDIKLPVREAVPHDEDALSCDTRGPPPRGLRARSEGPPRSRRQLSPHRRSLKSRTPFTECDSPPLRRSRSRTPVRRSGRAASRPPVDYSAIIISRSPSSLRRSERNKSRTRQHYSPRRTSRASPQRRSESRSPSRRLTRSISQARRRSRSRDRSFERRTFRSKSLAPRRSRSRSRAPYGRETRSKSRAPRRSRSRSRAPYGRETRSKSRAPRRSRSRSRVPHGRETRSKSRAPRRSRSRSRAPYGRETRSKSRAPRRSRSRSRSRAPYGREIRSKSRAPRRSRSRSRSSRHLSGRARSRPSRRSRSRSPVRKTTRAACRRPSSRSPSRQPQRSLRSKSQAPRSPPRSRGKSRPPSPLPRQTKKAKKEPGEDAVRTQPSPSKEEEQCRTSTTDTRDSVRRSPPWLSGAALEVVAVATNCVWCEGRGFDAKLAKTSQEHFLALTLCHCVGKVDGLHRIGVIGWAIWSLTGPGQEVVRVTLRKKDLYLEANEALRKHSPQRFRRVEVHWASQALGQAEEAAREEALRVVLGKMAGVVRLRERRLEEAIEATEYCALCLEHGVPRRRAEHQASACNYLTCWCWCCQSISPYPGLLRMHGIDKFAVVRLSKVTRGGTSGEDADSESITGPVIGSVPDLDLRKEHNLNKNFANDLRKKYASICLGTDSFDELALESQEDIPQDRERAKTPAAREVHGLKKMILHKHLTEDGGEESAPALTELRPEPFTEPFAEPFAEPFTEPPTGLAVAVRKDLFFPRILASPSPQKRASVIVSPSSCNKIEPPRPSPTLPSGEQILPRCTTPILSPAIFGSPERHLAPDSHHHHQQQQQQLQGQQQQQQDPSSMTVDVGRGRRRRDRRDSKWPSTTIPSDYIDVVTSERRVYGRQCRRCNNHGLSVPLAGHKGNCPFAECKCVLCQRERRARSRPPSPEDTIPRASTTAQASSPWTVPLASSDALPEVTSARPASLLGTHTSASSTSSSSRPSVETPDAASSSTSSTHVSPTPRALSPRPTSSSTMTIASTMTIPPPPASPVSAPRASSPSRPATELPQPEPSASPPALPFECSWCSKPFPNQAELDAHALSHVMPEELGYVDVAEANESESENKTPIAPIAQDEQLADQVFVTVTLDEGLSFGLSAVQLTPAVAPAVADVNSLDTVYHGVQHGVPSHPDESSTPSRPPTCSNCGLSFQTRLQHARHRVTVHTSEAVHTCPSCQACFTSRVRERAHVLTMHSAIAHACPLCVERFPSTLLLNAHLMVSHLLPCTLQCPLCREVCVSAMHLTAHLRASHPFQLPLRCALCPRGFHNMHALLQHHQGHVATLRRQHCAVCVAWFPANELRLAHERAQHGDPPRFTCPVNPCDVIKEDGKALGDHLAAEHPRRRPYRCPCGATFARPATFMAHAVASLHLAVQRPKTTRCRECGLLSDDVLHVRAHEDKDHMGLVPLDRAVQLVCLMQDAKVIEKANAVNAQT